LFRSSTADSTWAARSSGRTNEARLGNLPMGVRAASTTNALRILGSLTSPRRSIGRLTRALADGARPAPRHRTNADRCRRSRAILRTRSREFRDDSNVRNHKGDTGRTSKRHRDPIAIHRIRARTKARADSTAVFHGPACLPSNAGTSCGYLGGTTDAHAHLKPSRCSTPEITRFAERFQRKDPKADGRYRAIHCRDARRVA